MDFTVLNDSESLISMQFSEYMKLPQVSNLSCNPLKEDLQTIPPNHFQPDWNARVKNNFETANLDRIVQM